MTTLTPGGGKWFSLADADEDSVLRLPFRLRIACDLAKPTKGYLDNDSTTRGAQAPPYHRSSQARELIRPAGLMIFL
jgi:hypothetical protein